MPSLKQPEPTLAEFITMTPTKEKDIVKWIRLVLEIIYGVVMSVLYIIRDTFLMVYPYTGKSLEGDHVLVTGGARGLGREICILLAKEGCQITCVDVLEKDLNDTVNLCNAIKPGCATYKMCDISDREKVRQLEKEVPPVDVLINNAGIVSSASIMEVPDEHIVKLFNVNVLSHYWTIRTFLPGMIKRKKGHIVATASAAAFTCAANITPYTSTKYAVTGMMACLREEFRRNYPEIKTTTIHPFFITPPTSSVAHWEKNSRIPDVTAEDVAVSTVNGIKKERITVTVPSILYFLLNLTQVLPSDSGEMWRDMFYANVEPLGHPSSNSHEKKQS